MQMIFYHVASAALDVHQDLWDAQLASTSQERLLEEQDPRGKYFCLYIWGGRGGLNYKNYPCPVEQCLNVQMKSDMW